MRWRQARGALHIRMKLLTKKVSTDVSQFLRKLAELELELRRDEILREILARHQDGKS